MSVLNLHDEGCDAGRFEDYPCTCGKWLYWHCDACDSEFLVEKETAQNLDQVRCRRGHGAVFGRLVRKPGPPVERATDATRLLDKTVMLPLAPENPFSVISDEGKLLGSATVLVVPGGLALRLILDPHNPESFDLDVEPDRTRFRVEAAIDPHTGALTGHIVLLSK